MIDVYLLIAVLTMHKHTIILDIFIYIVIEQDRERFLDRLFNLFILAYSYYLLMIFESFVPVQNQSALLN